MRCTSNTCGDHTDHEIGEGRCESRGTKYNPRTAINFTYQIRHKITGFVTDVTFEFDEVYNGLAKEMFSNGLYKDYTIVKVDTTLSILFSGEEGKDLKNCIV